MGDAPAPQTTAFDYTAATAMAEREGFQWSDAVADQVDREFVNLVLDQRQVDRLLVLYVHYMKWATNPANLSFWQRVKAAAYFLRGKR